MESSLQFRQEFEARLLPPWPGLRFPLAWLLEGELGMGSQVLLGVVSSSWQRSPRQLPFGKLPGSFRRAEPGLQCLARKYELGLGARSTKFHFGIGECCELQKISSWQGQLAGGCGLAIVKFGGAGVVEYLPKHPD
ncbi:unnamed protein product [Prunus armeniaca]|uniref:Uncharacterized protein n=1 Tax=Prunus armeniaca TaxID=36596 RepID=A0A6J5W1C3_PRUAR|nr:unnamed protein product [Prunus armeniaca]